jgi:hypothetical protein
MSIDISAPAMSAAPAAPAETPARFSRALLALTAAATIAAAPFAGYVFGLAGSGRSAHSVPIYGFARLVHDVGQNGWAFQGQTADLVAWLASFAGVGLFWLFVAVWMRIRGGRYAVRMLLAAWAVEILAGSLTVGAVVFAEHTSTFLGPFVLRLADLGSPWWACVAAMLVVARKEHSLTAVRGALAYALLLAVLLLLPLPGPDAIKVFVLAAVAAVPAILAPGQAGAETKPDAGSGASTVPAADGPGSVTPGAAAAG